MTNPQELHYANIHDEYTAHYFDPYALEFRRRFIVDILFANSNLNGKRVADLAAGSGFNSLLLREKWPDVEVVGFDISEPACTAYRANVNSVAHRVDLSVEQSFDGQFDAAMVIGGLHHCVNNLGGTLRNISRMVKPGGCFYLYEPNARFVLQALRDFWYRRDRYFDQSTERALTHEELIVLAQDYFEPERVLYLGGPAYFLVLNSLITRVPLQLKRALAASLFPLEGFWNRHCGERGCPVLAAVWRRTGRRLD